eukprot:TRINITY_DN1490_c0_g1_i1.p1 TRINITY_DN1490_c0_g1~~TRINITY_DN1490_c0_g1_i1.p1  ORF type:complete len:428 (+),score=49.40 TRINITY_DN1490_c0_g1_i1:205-1488(+)
MEYLPVETLFNIFSYLEYDALCVLTSISRRLSIASSEGLLWKALCGGDWGILNETDFDGVEGLRGINFVVDANINWKLVYKVMQRVWGRYKSVYRRVKSMWNRLEVWLKANCPQVYHSLAPPCEEKEILPLQRRVSIPLEYQCSLRIHNGQNFSKPVGGLLGGFQVYHTEEDLYLANIAQIEMLLPAGNFICLASAQTVASFNPNSIRGLFIAGSNMSSLGLPHPQGTVLRTLPKGVKYLCFESESFIDYMERYTRDLEIGRFDCTSRNIIRFPTFAKEGSDVTTKGIRVRANALLLHSLSMGYWSKSEPHKLLGQFLFAYRIRISMDANENPENSAQLESRHWEIIEGESGRETIVDGEGVIGKFPVITPGSYFEYASQTQQESPYGNIMKGYFRMRLRNGLGYVNAEVAPFALDFPVPQNLHLSR